MKRIAYTRADLEKLLVQDFGCTWAAARLAVSRYVRECCHGVPSWQFEFYGGWNEQVAITEWIWGNKDYWRSPNTRRVKKMSPLYLEYMQIW